jgi:hypothetical protein
MKAKLNSISYADCFVWSFAPVRHWEEKLLSENSEKLSRRFRFPTEPLQPRSPGTFHMTYASMPFLSSKTGWFRNSHIYRLHHTCFRALAQVTASPESIGPTAAQNVKTIKWSGRAMLKDAQTPKTMQVFERPILIDKFLRCSNREAATLLIYR